ncbi:MAG: hypothetical protein LBC18_16420, partial [Opitutaceae bacterium]|nr:hypothetical protein [Opitutaceae bacterium]
MNTAQHINGTPGLAGFTFTGTGPAGEFPVAKEHTFVVLLPSRHTFCTMPNVSFSPDAMSVRDHGDGNVHFIWHSPLGSAGYRLPHGSLWGIVPPGTAPPPPPPPPPGGPPRPRGHGGGPPQPPQ